MNFFITVIIIGVCLCAINLLVLMILKTRNQKQQAVERDHFDLSLVEEDLNKEMSQLQTMIEQNINCAQAERKQLELMGQNLQQAMKQAQELLEQLIKEKDSLEFIKSQLEIVNVASKAIESQDLSDTQVNLDKNYETIGLLLDKGLSHQDIASKVNMSVSEVQLRAAILNRERKRRPVLARQLV